MDVLAYNKLSWDNQSASGESPWSQIVPKEVIEQAKSGKYQFGMGPSYKPLPEDWLGDVRGKQLLCLAGGGGQQAPTLAAMGAEVTVYDLSANQLGLDQQAAKAYGLDIKTIQGDMADLSPLKPVLDAIQERKGQQGFDLIVNPASTMFVPDITKVWQECHKVLRPGGKLIATTMNPMSWAFGPDELDTNANPTLRYSVPYSDINSLNKEQLDAIIAKGYALEYGHSLSDTIGGQLSAGLVLIGMMESYWGEGFGIKGDKMFPQYIHTCAQKPI